LTKPKPKDIEVILTAPISLRGDARYARKAFVGLVSPMNLHHLDSTVQSELDQEPQKLSQLIRDLDFSTLKPESSNLGQLLSGILAHQERLEHCWLVTTPDSLRWAELVREYLKVKGLRCRFYVDEAYTVAAKGGSNDSEVVRRTYEVVKAVFLEAGALGLPPTEMVVDITGAWKTLSFAATLACLSKERDIQYVGAEYDAQGKPIRNLLNPIIFSFEPQLLE
jgi:hypothetical protein